MLCVRACARGLNLVVLLLCSSKLIDLNQLSCVGASASPFIDEGDGLTSERERVRMFTKSCCPCCRVQDDCRRP